MAAGRNLNVTLQMPAGSGEDRLSLQNRDGCVARAVIPMALTMHGSDPALGATTGEPDLVNKSTSNAAKPRERLLDAAYELFATNGVSQVGIDTILAKARCAKASLYGNFNSKVDLAIAFLDRREIVWTRGWLETEIKKRASKPEDRLLAIFDVFDGWFRKRSFEGCSFINVLLESNVESPMHRAAAIHLSKIRAIVQALAQDSKLRDPEQFAQVWHMLMKGSIIAACEGNRNAARDAKRAARLVLDGWPQTRSANQR